LYVGYCDSQSIHQTWKPVTSLFSKIEKATQNLHKAIRESRFRSSSLAAVNAIVHCGRLCLHSPQHPRWTVGDKSAGRRKHLRNRKYITCCTVVKKDRTAATGNFLKFEKWFLKFVSRQTNKHTDTKITILHTPAWGRTR